MSRPKHKRNSHRESPIVPDDLQAVLRAAWREAIRQHEDSVSTPLPAALVPFKGFRAASLPLQPMFDAIEADSGFRARIGESVSEEDAGQVGWLWLIRPDGWKATVNDTRSKRRESTVGDKLVSRAKDVLKRLSRELDKSDKCLHKAQKERRAAEERLKACRRDARDREEALEQADSDYKRAHAERLHAEKRKSEADEALERAGSTLERAKQKEAAARSARSEIASGIAEIDNEPTCRKKSRDKTRPPPTEEATLPLPQSVRPVQLPDGVCSGTPDEIEALLRVPDVVLVVDGYNVGYTKWPPPDHRDHNGSDPTQDGSDESTIQDTRRRVERHCTELAARFRVRLILVWDSCYHPETRTIPSHPGSQIVYAANADDHIVETCQQTPLTVPLVTVTDDNQLRRRVKAASCNVVGVDEFWSVLASPR